MNDREENGRAAAAHHHRQEDRDHRSPGVGFMRTRQADAVEDERSQTGEEPSANRDELQRVRRTAGVTENAKGGFERLIGASDDHQTNVRNRSADEYPHDEKDRDKQERKRPSISQAQASAATPFCRSLMIPTDLHDERKTERDHRAHRRPESPCKVSGSANPPSRFMIEKACSGRVKTIIRVSMSALMRVRPSRFSQGNPVRCGVGPGVTATTGLRSDRTSPAQVAGAAECENSPALTRDATWAFPPSSQDRCR